MMIVLHTAAILLTLVALFSYLNYRFVSLPNTIVVMTVAAAASLIMVLLGKLGWDDLVFYTSQVLGGNNDLSPLMQSLLGLLLFVAALQLNLQELKSQSWVVAAIALISTALSVVLIGSLLWLVLRALGAPLEYFYCLFFGLLISPTDSIGLLGVLRSVRVAKSMETMISGESVCNNAITVILFALFAAVFANPDAADTVLTLPMLQLLLGGMVWGVLLGVLMYYLLKGIEQQSQLAMLLTLSLSLAGEAVALWLGLSVPVALLIAGVFLANNSAMTDGIREQLKLFWGLINEIVLMGLFVVLGLALLLLPVRVEYLLAALAIIPVVIFARYVGVGLPILVLQRYRRFHPGMARLLTWGALRGGISAALILTLPQNTTRDVLLVLTYAVVIFSVSVQGLVLNRMLDEVR
jgi:CPA1 family monovalent cation:H+ antiporter